MVEQWTENPRVGGSIPPPGTTFEIILVVVLQFFAWGINKHGVMDQRAALVKTHWAFIARYDSQLIERGPVMQLDDRSIVTGSTHIVELDSLEEAEKFVNEEPFAQAGLFESIIFHRFQLELGRTQFEFQSIPDYPRYFIYCLANEGQEDPRQELAEAHEAYCHKFDANFVCRGSIFSEADSWMGSVFFMEVPSQDKIAAFLADEPYKVAGLYEKTDIHRWTMGGPRNLNSSGTPIND